MYAFVLGCFALTLLSFGMTVGAIFRCRQLGVNPNDLFEGADIYFLAKLSGCVTIVLLAILILIGSGVPTGYQPL